MADTLLYVTECAPYGPGRVAGVHRVLPQSVGALAQIADLSGLGFAHTDDVRTLTPDALAQASVLALFTIGETRWSGEQRRTILERLRAGALHVLGIHSVTDSCHGWPEFGEVIGARFDGHPWTQELAIVVADAAHPATRHLPERWRLPDEVYLFRDLRDDARVLLRLDPEGLDMTRPGARVPAAGFPLAWSFSEGAGRVFYTALGHFPEAWENVAYLAHLNGGLEWLLTGVDAAA